MRDTRLLTSVRVSPAALSCEAPSPSPVSLPHPPFFFLRALPRSPAVLDLAISKPAPPVRSASLLLLAGPPLPSWTALSELPLPVLGDRDNGGQAHCPVVHRSCRLLGFLQSFDLDLTRTQSSPCPRSTPFLCMWPVVFTLVRSSGDHTCRLFQELPASGFSGFHTSLSLEICRSFQWPPDGKNLSVTLPDISSQRGGSS